MDTPSSGQDRAQQETDEELAGLIRRAEQHADAYIRGDTRTALDLAPHAHDFTLMPPNGGVRTEVDSSDEAVAATAEFFAGAGEARLEVVSAHRSGDLAVLAVVERQHGEVGGMPDQDWSLRVTLVYRREGREWRVVHRHADPLVQETSMETVSALAKGQL